MENASKALLIAASILIVIILIAFGMKIVNSTDNVTDETTQVSDYMSLESQISIIDLQFSKYNGTQKGTIVKEMLKQVGQYNKENGNYKVVGDNTTQYYRKIAIHLSGANPASNTGWDVIEGNYYNFIDANKTYKITTEKNRSETYKSYIYIIYIKPN